MQNRNSAIYLNKDYKKSIKEDSLIVSLFIKSIWIKKITNQNNMVFILTNILIWKHLLSYFKYIRLFKI